MSSILSVDKDLFSTLLSSRGVLTLLATLAVIYLLVRSQLSSFTIGYKLMLLSESHTAVISQKLREFLKYQMLCLSLAIYICLEADLG